MQSELVLGLGAVVAAHAALAVSHVRSLTWGAPGRLGLAITRWRHVTIIVSGLTLIAVIAIAFVPGDWWMKAPDWVRWINSAQEILAWAVVVVFPLMYIETMWRVARGFSALRRARMHRM